MTKKKIPIGTSSFDVDNPGVKALADKYCLTLIPNPYKRKLTREEEIEFFAGAEGVLAGLEMFDDDIFSSLPQLKAIARIGIGTENIDFEAAKKHNIKVSNTPDAPTYAVAEMTVTALLTILRGVISANEALHNGKWAKQVNNSVRDKCVLLVGYGRIAQEVKTLLEPFKPRILIFDPNLAEYNTSLKKLLSQADIVSLHASGKNEIIGETEISLMRDGVVILNSARGVLINEPALVKGLENGKVAMYWGDVFAEEPYTGELTRFENALLTPHISTYTKFCRDNMEIAALENLLKDLGLLT